MSTRSLIRYRFNQNESKLLKKCKHIPKHRSGNVHASQNTRRGLFFNESPPYPQVVSDTDWADGPPAVLKTALNEIILRGQHDIMGNVIGWHALKGCTVTCDNEYCMEPARPERDKIQSLAILSYQFGEKHTDYIKQQNFEEPILRCKKQCYFMYLV